METLNGLLEISGLQKSSASLDFLAEQNARYIKDLKVNISNALAYETLTEKERWLLTLAVATNESKAALRAASLEKAREAGASDAELCETIACVSLLNTNNVFYRFRHFTKKEFYETTPAGIKMSIMVNPILGKEFFELLSLAVSALNGCELCVNAHEESLRRLGTTEVRIYEAIRLTSIVKGLAVLTD